MHVRAATHHDAGAIAAVYNQGIEERATFETRTHAAAAVEPWIAGAATLPLLAAVEGEELLGWAKLSPYTDRRQYAHVAEVSVYVDRSGRRQGVGRALLEELHGEAERRGLLKVVGLLFPDNRPSVVLFDALGYREVGTLRRHGRDGSRWRDVLLVERLLGEAAG